MSYQYDRYLAQHKSNVEAGFRWLQKNLPKITEASGAEHNIVFALYMLTALLSTEMSTVSVV